VKRLECVGLLARAHEADRLARHLAHRQRHAALRVTVCLGQHDARQGQALVEGRRGIDGVLTCHAVDDKERLDRRRFGVNGLHLGHHVTVDVQAAGRVDNQYVGMLLACVVKRPLDNRDGLFVRAARRMQRTDLAGQRLELLYRSRLCTSTLTSMTRFLSRSIRLRASLAAVVVLPAPCNPASMTTTGG
jgi:hypothetical protein